MPTTRNFVFNKNPKINSLYTIRTPDVLSSIWKYLGRYKSVKYTKSVLSRQITQNTSLITKKSNQIAFTVRQAENYFLSARTADISIKPLLIYYGILGLAKCLIISGDNQYTLDATQLDYNEHGLHGLSWKVDLNNQQQVSARKSNALTREFCKTKTSGVYPLFRKCYADVVPPNDTEVNVKTLLSLIGENWQIYHSYFSQAPRIYGCDDPKNGDVITMGDNLQLVGRFSDYYYQFHKTKRDEGPKRCVERLFPELRTLYDYLGYRYRSKGNVVSMDSHIVFSRTQTLQGFALVQPYNTFKITEFDIYFLLFYILSNLCRYRQDKWRRITARIAVPDQFFLIENIFEIVQYKFPLLILRELEAKDYSFIGEVATLG